MCSSSPMYLTFCDDQLTSSSLFSVSFPLREPQRAKITSAIHHCSCGIWQSVWHQERLDDFLWMRELIYPATGQRKLGQLVAMLLKINVSKTFASLSPYLSSLERFPYTKQPKYMCYHIWEEISILQNSPI